MPSSMKNNPRTTMLPNVHFSCLPARDKPAAHQCSRTTPEGIYAQGRRLQFGGRSRRKSSTVAYASLQSEVSSATLAP
jgi:hypothetical protein